jgi:hypothetical protein
VLSDGQKRELQILIQQFIGAGPSYDMITELVGHEAVDHLPGQLNVSSAARWIIDIATDQPSATLFVSIVTKVNSGGESPDLHAMTTQLLTDPTTWTSTSMMHDLWVPPTWPFVDRTDLRTLVREAARGEGPPALTIEAPAGHGKRTMSDYIDLVTRRTGTFKPVARTLEPGPDPGLLDALVADLRLALALPLAGPTTHEEPERQAEVLALALAREARFASQRVWFVAYLVKPSDLEPGVLRFVDEMLGAVQEDELTARHLRVAVLTDDTRASALTRLPPPEARFVLPEVDALSVTEWLAAAVPGKPPGLYAELTNTVLEQLEARGAAPSRRLEWLARHCLEAHRLLQEA